MNIKKTELVKYSTCEFCKEDAMIVLPNTNITHCENCNIIQMNYMSADSFGEYSFTMCVEVSFEEIAERGVNAIDESNVFDDGECQRISDYDYPLMVESAKSGLESSEAYLINFAKEKMKKAA